MIKTFASTHIGLVRERNEDRYLIKKTDADAFLLVVADGMGGEIAGDFAAEILMETMKRFEPNLYDHEQYLSQLVKEADRAIRNEVKKDPELEGMGTTVTGMLLNKHMASWVHVGDSRLYLLRRGELVQITTDQNWAQFLVEEGEITAEEARHHVLSNVLDQCVGSGECAPETGHIDVQHADLLMLSTDGLHGELPEETISNILTFQTDIETRVKSLIQSALDTGGKDNITVLAAEIA